MDALDRVLGALERMVRQYCYVAEQGNFQGGWKESASYQAIGSLVMAGQMKVLAEDPQFGIIAVFVDEDGMERS